MRKGRRKYWTLCHQYCPTPWLSFRGEVDAFVSKKVSPQGLGVVRPMIKQMRRNVPAFTLRGPCSPSPRPISVLLCSYDIFLVPNRSLFQLICMDSTEKRRKKREENSVLKIASDSRTSMLPSYLPKGKHTQEKMPPKSQYHTGNKYCLV